MVRAATLGDEGPFRSSGHSDPKLVSEVPLGWGCGPRVACYARLPRAIPTAGPRRISMRLGISSHGRARGSMRASPRPSESQGLGATACQQPPGARLPRGPAGAQCPRAERYAHAPSSHGTAWSLVPPPPGAYVQPPQGRGRPQACCGLCAASARAGGRFNVPRGPSLALGGRCTGTFRTLELSPRPPPARDHASVPASRHWPPRLGDAGALAYYSSIIRESPCCQNRAPHRKHL
jgi:hypothetical protein